MSEDSISSDAALPARRRIVALPERRAPLPVAIIAHEGPELEALEEHISRTRPVETFPSLAHFGADESRREKWAGIVIARMHAWDARLDEAVQRRAFIALYRLADEGHGWPDSVRRVGSTEELDAWLTDIAAPVLPADDRRRVSKPRPKRSVFTMSLAEPDSRSSAAPRVSQLTLPSLSIPAVGKPEVKVVPAPTRKAAPAAAAVEIEARAVEGPSGAGSTPPAIKPRARVGAARKAPQAEKVTAITPTKQAPAIQRRTRAIALDHASRNGLRLTSHDAHEQAVLDAARVLGVPSARAIVSAVEECELS